MEPSHTSHTRLTLRRVSPNANRPPRPNKYCFYDPNLPRSVSGKPRFPTNAHFTALSVPADGPAAFLAPSTGRRRSWAAAHLAGTGGGVVWAAVSPPAAARLYLRCVVFGSVIGLFSCRLIVFSCWLCCCVGGCGFDLFDLWGLIVLCLI